MKTKPSRANVVSALTARTQFGQIMKRATQKNERFVVDRRGEPSVIIMSVKDYVDAMAPPPEELRAMQVTAKRTGASKISAREIGKIISEVRRSNTASASKRKAS